MLCLQVSKWVGDSITHPFYHAVLEMKCIPFLDSEPFITHNNKPIALELFRACDCMTSSVVVSQTAQLIVFSTENVTTTFNVYILRINIFWFYPGWTENSTEFLILSFCIFPLDSSKT